MRKFVSLLVAVGLLFGAYAITFGLPGTDATSEAAQPQSAAGCLLYTSDAADE